MLTNGCHLAFGQFQYCPESFSCDEQGGCTSTGSNIVKYPTLLKFLPPTDQSKTNPSGNYGFELGQIQNTTTRLECMYNQGNGGGFNQVYFEYFSGLKAVTGRDKGWEQAAAYSCKKEDNHQASDCLLAKG